MDDYEGGFMQSSPKKENKGTKTIRNLTIKQLCTIEPDETNIFRIDNEEIVIATIFGWIRDTKTVQSGVFLNIEDGTGTIRCSFWPSKFYDEVEIGLLTTGNLIRAIGNPRPFEGKMTFQIVSFRVIDDHNFIVFHFLSCLQQHFYNTGRLKREEKKTIKISKINDDVLECFRKHQDENGLHVEAVVKMMTGKHTEKDIRHAISELIDDCHIYSVDGEEYKTTI